MAERWKRPVIGGFITSGFGDSGPRWTNKHTGMDIAVPLGTPVRASASGTVVRAGWENNAYGTTVVLDHGNGWRTRYAHLLGSRTPANRQVSQGRIIALVGNSGNVTGSHLHFEILHNGKPQNPENLLGTEVGGSAVSGNRTPAGRIADIDLTGGVQRVGLFVGGVLAIGGAIIIMVRERLL